MNSETAIAIIPARYRSTRLPGKPIIEIDGKTLIERVYKRVQQARSIRRIVVATDDARIFRAVEQFGGEARMTRDDHQSGTDRLAEAASDLSEDTIVVNVQGDEPMIEPEVIDLAVMEMRAGNAEIVTLQTKLEAAAAIADPNRVKVVSNKDGYALYFSRSPIPSSGTTFLHLGLYAYRVGFLRKFTRLEPTPLEKAERLEQLRALEHGFRIRVVEVESASWGIDTPADLEKYRAVLNGVKGLD